VLEVVTLEPASSVTRCPNPKDKNMNLLINTYKAFYTAGRGLPQPNTNVNIFASQSRQSAPSVFLTVAMVTLYEAGNSVYMSVGCDVYSTDFTLRRATTDFNCIMQSDINFYCCCSQTLKQRDNVLLQAHTLGVNAHIIACGT
jgi:hypothetical protein